MAVFNKLTIMPELKALAAGQAELAQAIATLKTDVKADVPMAWATVEEYLRMAWATVEEYLRMAWATVEEHLREEIRSSEARTAEHLGRLHAELVAQRDTVTRHLEGHAVHAA